MSWLRLRIEVGQTRIPALEAQLESLGAISVTVTDAGNSPVLEPDPGSTPLWPQSRLEALFDLNVDLAALRASLSTAGTPVQELQVDFLEDQDWQQAWRQHAVRLFFGERLWVLPRDTDPVSSPAILLDPGLAFGSGSHPTTRLCLEWLAGQRLEGLRVLDFGCGSGILALAALRLGAAEVVAVDHDPQALLATRENAAYNGLADERLTVIAPADLRSRDFDLVVANILANPLIELAPVLKRAMNVDATLVMSGLLEHQSDAVIKAYPEMNFDPPATETDDQNGSWVRLVGMPPGKSGRQ